VSGVPSSRIGPREIYRSPYIVLRYDSARRIVVLTRLPEHYPTLDAMRETFAQMEESMAHIWRQRTVMLIDSRRGPARNDTTFETEFARLRKHFLRDLQKVVTVVQTAVGVLQVSRHMRKDELPLSVFTEVPEALAYLGVSMPAEFIDLPE
jgi:hypothetical protein